MKLPELEKIITALRKDYGVTIILLSEAKVNITFNNLFSYINESIVDIDISEMPANLPSFEQIKKWFMQGVVFMNKQTLHRISSLNTKANIIRPICIGSEWLSINEFCRKYTHCSGRIIDNIYT